MATLTPPGLEADDVNASAATWAEQNDWNCVIVTSDRDSFENISEHTQVLRMITGGMGNSPLLNPKRLQALYGVAAANYLDRKSVVWGKRVSIRVALGGGGNKKQK